MPSTPAASGAARVALVIVGQRAPVDSLYQRLMATEQGAAATLPFTLARIGDCEAPAIIAAAIYAGHRYARELDPGGYRPADAA